MHGAVVLFTFLTWITVSIFFILNLQNTLKAISVYNQTMTPLSVWWLLMPFFGTVWIFVVVKNISKSIKLELTERGILTSPRPTFATGMIYSIWAAIFAATNLLYHPDNPMFFLFTG